MNKFLKKLVADFAKEYKKEIKYCCVRGRCGVITPQFADYAKKYGVQDIKIVNGYFVVDKPSYVKNDFTLPEIDFMVSLGLNPNLHRDRKLFAEKAMLVDELCKIPHAWNVIDGEIVDFTAQSQFVKTKLSRDTRNSRYIVEKEWRR